jgi:hypothetical protein
MSQPKKPRTPAQDLEHKRGCPGELITEIRPALLRVHQTSDWERSMRARAGSWASAATCP